MSQTISDDARTLEKIGTNLVYSVMGGAGAMDSSLRPLWPSARLCGPAFTVECVLGDRLTMYYAVLNAQPGEVIVASTQGVPELAYFALMMGAVAKKRGLAGLVVDGCVRDSEPLEKLGFPIFCRGIALKGARKTTKGAHGVPITLAGQTISPGDYILGDRDGLLVIPKDRVNDELMAKAKKKYESEQTEFESISGDLSSPQAVAWRDKAVARMSNGHSG